MNAAADRQRAPQLGDCSSIDVMSRYIAVTAQLRCCAADELIAQRAELRDIIIDRLGLSVGMAFINEVERAAQQ